MTAMAKDLQCHKPNAGFAEADMTTRQLADRALIQSTPEVRAHRVL